VSTAYRDSCFIERQYRALISRQHGIITTAQTQELGLTKQGLNRRVKRGELVRVLPRVYRSAVVAPSPLQAALAAVSWAGPSAVASHATAAHVWRLGDCDDRSLHVWVPPDRAPSSKLVVVHRGVVDASDRRLRDGIPVTAPARTVVDLASMLDDETLEAVMESALHRGLTTSQSLWRCLDRVGGTGRAGVSRLRHHLDDRGERALESRLEVKVWRLLRSAGLRPVRQHEIRCGTRRYRVDFAWPKQKVAVEAEGFAAHGGRTAFTRDRRRAADLAAAGWVIVPVTWDDCAEQPQIVVERVHRALVRAA